jgi:hypothetical protein
MPGTAAKRHPYPIALDLLVHHETSSDGALMSAGFAQRTALSTGFLVSPANQLFCGGGGGTAVRAAQMRGRRAAASISAA